MAIASSMPKRKIRYPEVGRRISDLIAMAFDDRGVRKADIARAVNKDWSTVYIWTKGMAMPRPENLVDLASVLDTTPEYIQHGITADRQPIRKAEPAYEECEKKLDDYRKMVSSLMRQNDSLQKQIDGLQSELESIRSEHAKLRACESGPSAAGAGVAL